MGESAQTTTAIDQNAPAVAVPETQTNPPALDSMRSDSTVAVDHIAADELAPIQSDHMMESSSLQPEGGGLERSDATAGPLTFDRAQYREAKKDTKDLATFTQWLTQAAAFDAEDHVASAWRSLNEGMQKRAIQHLLNRPAGSEFNEPTDIKAAKKAIKNRYTGRNNFGTKTKKVTWKPLSAAIQMVINKRRNEGLPLPGEEDDLSGVDDSVLYDRAAFREARGNVADMDTFVAFLKFAARHDDMREYAATWEQLPLQVQMRAIDGLRPTATKVEGVGLNGAAYNLASTTIGRRDRELLRKGRKRPEKVDWPKLRKTTNWAMRQVARPDYSDDDLHTTAPPTYAPSSIEAAMAESQRLPVGDDRGADGVNLTAFQGHEKPALAADFASLVAGITTASIAVEKGLRAPSGNANGTDGSLPGETSATGTESSSDTTAPSASAPTGNANSTDGSLPGETSATGMESSSDTTAPSASAPTATPSSPTSLTESLSSNTASDADTAGTPDVDSFDFDVDALSVASTVSSAIAVVTAIAHLVEATKENSDRKDDATVQRAAGPAMDLLRSSCGLAFQVIDKIPSATADLTRQGASDALAGAVTATGVANIIAGVVYAAKGVYDVYQADQKYTALDNLLKSHELPEEIQGAAWVAMTTQKNRKVKGAADIVKGTLLVAGGATLLALGVASPVGWALLGTAALVGALGVMYTIYVKTKRKTQLVDKDLGKQFIGGEAEYNKLTGPERDNRRTRLLRASGYSSVGEYYEEWLQTTARHLHERASDTGHAEHDDALDFLISIGLSADRAVPSIQAIGRCLNS